MAVVKLGNKVKTNLPDTIRYVINPEKNDGGRLVYASYSSERHDANTLAEPMIRDLERCANGLRKDGVLALHLKHSFSPDEHVSAEQVHELGVMLTEAITGGDYKYVVSTHGSASPAQPHRHLRGEPEDGKEDASDPQKHRPVARGQRRAMPS